MILEIINLNPNADIEPAGPDMFSISINGRPAANLSIDRAVGEGDYGVTGFTDFGMSIPEILEFMSLYIFINHAGEAVKKEVLKNSGIRDTYQRTMELFLRAIPFHRCLRFEGVQADAKMVDMRDLPFPFNEGEEEEPS